MTGMFQARWSIGLTIIQLDDLPLMKPREAYRRVLRETKLLPYKSKTVVTPLDVVSHGKELDAEVDIPLFTPSDKADMFRL